jgi:hypothetical protein
MFMVFARYLDFAHSRGVLHGGLNPYGIVVDAQTQQLLMDDKGDAKIDGVSDPETYFVGYGQLSTFFCLEDENDDRSLIADVRRLGGILYWVLYGLGPNETPGERFKNIRAMWPAAIAPKKRRPPRRMFLPRTRELRHRTREAFRALERICLKSLELDARHRQQRPNELADELQVWLDQYNIGERGTIVPRV